MFGPDTERALRKFQRNTGLLPDGTCVSATFSVLTQLVRTVGGGVPHAMRETELIRRSGPSLAGRILVIGLWHGADDPRGTRRTPSGWHRRAFGHSSRIRRGGLATALPAPEDRSPTGVLSLPPTVE